MTSHPTTISTLTRHIYTYITSLQNRPFKYKYIYIYMYKLKIFVYIYMMPFNPPPNKKKKHASKKGLFFVTLLVSTSFIVHSYHPEPPTWYHHHQPGSKSSSFKRQFGKLRGTDSPGWILQQGLRRQIFSIPRRYGTKENGGWLAGCTPGN